MSGPIAPDPVPMRVIDVRRESDARGPLRRHVVILEDASGAQRLPIYVGQSEGTAIALELTGAELPRPMTYAFVQGLLDAVGGTLAEVRINRLADETFYAAAILDGAHGPATVDARPSDAINLALIVGAPITVDPGVLAECERRGHHVISESDFSDQADRIAADAVAMTAWCPPPKSSVD